MLSPLVAVSSSINFMCVAFCIMLHKLSQRLVLVLTYWGQVYFCKNVDEIKTVTRKTARCNNCNDLVNLRFILKVYLEKVLYFKNLFIKIERKW